MKAVILTRVSSKEQEEGHSLAAQNTRLTEYANRKNFEVIKSFQIIESSTRGNRKEFTAMINFCKKQKETIAIIADAVDRIQRSFKESVMLDNLIRQEKIELHFYREGMVISKNANSMDIMRWDFAVMGAKSYVLQLSENVRRSLEYKNNNGEYAGQAPTGYINCHNDHGKAWIKPDEIQGPLLQKLFVTYSLGRSSLGELKKEADRIGARSRTGKPLTVSTLHHIIKNPFYYGEMRIKDKTFPHCYQPLISKDIWDRCQTVRLSAGKKPFKYSEMPFLYRGLIRCAHTGKMCTNELKKGQFSYVVCYDAEGRRKYIPETEVDAQIILILKTLQFPKTFLDEINNHLRQSQKAEIEFRNKEIGVLQANLSKTNNRLDKLLNLFLDGEIDKDLFEAKKEQLRTEKSRLMIKMTAHNKADDCFNDLLSEILDLARNSWIIFENCHNLELKRKLLKMIFHTLELKDNKLGYALNFPFSKVQNLANLSPKNAFARTAKTQEKTKACDLNHKPCPIWLRLSDSNQRPIG